MIHPLLGMDISPNLAQQRARIHRAAELER